MFRYLSLSLSLSLAYFAGPLTHKNAGLSAQPRDYPIAPVPFSEVIIHDDFWGPRIATNHTVTIPIAYAQSDKTGRIDNFRIAGGLQEGQFCTEYPFDDSDIYKLIEAASYSLQTFPDPALEQRLDSLIHLIALAQEPDGYLYTNRTIGKNLHPWAGDRRWEKVHELSHELYNLGHLYEAAVAHHRATGQRNLLDVAIRSAELVERTFGAGRIENVPGHQEIEIGLVKLYRATQDARYLDLAKFFLDIRGRADVGRPKPYDQSHLPVVAQSEAVGHAVRGAYMWAAMADIAAITGDSAYLRAIDRIWHDIVDKKYYLNGGIGATGSGEAFGQPYELPNMSAYCETCAGVGNAIWNHRMFLMTGHSQYIDVLERTMYNNILAGVSLSGDRFFYPNPLASFGQHERSAWFGCACCPPNVARFLPSMPGYIYARRADSIYVNLYVGSSVNFDLGGQELALRQESDFPWQGRVALAITQAPESAATLKLRIPGYVRNRPVPSDLYTYRAAAPVDYSVTLNGTPVKTSVDAAGYVTLARTWTAGDRIELDFPFPVQKVQAHRAVAENRGKLAFERGPLLYCAEWPDNPNGKVLSLIVDPETEFTPEIDSTLNGIVALHGRARRSARRLDGTVNISGYQDLTLIPYPLWNNRGPGEMAVWLATEPAYAEPEPAPTIARRSRITASEASRGSTLALHDQRYPAHSNDHSVAYLHWWPQAGTREWVQLDFAEAETISQVKVYWFDDGPHGGCRVPAAWSVEYLRDDAWQPVAVTAQDEVTKDAWNTVRFEAVEAAAIRVAITLPAEHATGLYEVIIE